MKCPKCGFVQPENPECLNCGILVDRYKPEEDRPPAEPTPPPQLSVVAHDDPASQPIRPGLRFVRTGAGAFGLAVGGWLFVAGQNLELAPHQVLFLIGYACVSLFWVISFPIRVPVRQFAIEMVIFVAATLLLKLALPAAFDLGRLSNKESAPLGGQTLEREFTQSVTPSAFARMSENLAALGRRVLDDSSNRAAVEKWREDADRLTRLYRQLQPEDRRDCERLYKAAVNLETRMKVALSDEGGLSATEEAFVALEALEREAFGFGQ